MTASVGQARITQRVTSLLIQAAERRATEVREEFASLEWTQMGDAEVARTLADFDPLCNALTLREQSRILKLLIERIEYDSKHGDVAITFRPSGIRNLLDQSTENEGEAA